MNREQLSELLSAYIDGEADDRQRALVERVLREDAAARRLLEELRRTINVVASLPRHAAPPTLAADLDAQLERAELLGGAEMQPVLARERRAPWTAWAAMAAMLGVVVFGGWWILPDHGTDGFKPADTKIAVTDAERGRRDADRPALPDGLSAVAHGELAKGSPALTVESQLAAGVDPAALTKQSFAPETVRLQVVALNAAERDSITDKFVRRLSEQKTENLANRGRRGGEANEPVGSFFVVGRPGVNFDDAKQRQVLVRVPRSQAAQLVDDLTAVAGSEDRVALQAGPMGVRGAAPAKELIQKVGGDPPKADFVAKKAKPSDATTTALADKPAESGKAPGGANRFDPLNELMKVVGLEAVVTRTPAREKESGQAGPAASGAADEASPPSATSAKGGADDEKAKVSPPSPPAEKKDYAEAAPAASPEESGSLVRRRLVEAEKARARAKAAEDASAVTKEPRSTLGKGERAKVDAPGAKPAATLGETGSVAREDDYVTIVIEFVVPSLQPTLPSAAKPPTPPTSKSSK